MSLVTLRSTQQDNGANVSQSSANFTNHFKDPIVLGPGNTIELVSMSIIKLDKYEIIQGENDTFIWRIGSGPSSEGGTPLYSQHVVTLVAGSYNGMELAAHIQEQLNNSTILGVYKGGWTCVFTIATGDTNAKFSISYSPVDTPAENGSEVTWTQDYLGDTPYTITSVTTPLDGKKYKWNATNMGVTGDKSSGYGFSSDRGIFSNGGRNTAIIPPVALMDEITTLTLLNNQIENYNNSGNNVLVTFEAKTLTNNWKYVAFIFNGGAGGIYTTAVQAQLGRITALHTFNGGSGYVIGDTGNIVATSGNGVNGTYTVQNVNGSGSVTAVTITNAGVGYAVNDNLDLVATSGSGSGTTAKVQTISSGDNGTGYANGDEGDVIGGSGSGAKYKVGLVGTGVGNIIGISIIGDRGSGYAVNDVVELQATTGTGSGAFAKILSIGPSGVRKVAVTDELGRLGMRNSENADATNPANWTFKTFTFNGNTPFPAEHRMTSTLYSNEFLAKENGGGLSFTVKETYPKTILGYARHALVTGDFSNSNAVYTNGKDGMDAQVVLTKDADTGKVYFNVYQLQKSGGINYPTAGWRTSKTICEDLDPTAWNAMPSSPANWTSFTFGADNIKISLNIDLNRNISFTASHDTGGNLTFTEEVTWLKSGNKKADSGGLMANDFTSTIREALYPLHGIKFTGKSTPFTEKEEYLGGIFDTEIIDPSNVVLASTAGGKVHNAVTLHDEIDMDYSNETNFVETTELVSGGGRLGPVLEVTTSAPALSAIFKMGQLTGDAIYNGPAKDAGPHQISIYSLSPNDGNINFLLGLKTAYNFKDGETSNTVETSAENKPLTTLSEPTLNVELPDFNIKSWSGQSSDAGRAVAVIPREQWTTDEKTGVLHYMAQYPIPIDLNLPTIKPFYELSCRLRSPDGTLADDLLNPTEVCLKIGETDESRQSRVMMKAMEHMGNMMANRQDQKISTMTTNMPLL